MIAAVLLGLSTVHEGGIGKHAVRGICAAMGASCGDGSTPPHQHNGVDDSGQHQWHPTAIQNFQKIGAFKIRGGMNAALRVPAEKLKNGLATHSSGNHAQAVAYAAKTLGTKAYIVMPDNSPAVKVNAVKGYGAQITFCEPTQAARESKRHRPLSVWCRRSHEQELLCRADDGQAGLC